MNRIALLLFFTAILATACQPESGSQGKKDTPAGKPLLAAVNYPLAYFAGLIGGEKIEVYFPEIEGDPAYWKANPEGIARFQEADLVLLNGADYAKWVQKASLPSSRLVNTSNSFHDHYITEEGAIAHSHGGGEMHTHGELAFTTWLNFEFADKQAQAIVRALIRLLPEEKEYFQANYRSLREQLLGLHSDFQALGQTASDKVIYASHPVYQYFAKAYGFQIISEHWEPEQAITPDQWASFKQKLDQQASTLMIWEGEPLADTRKHLEGMGMTVIVFDPCGNTTVGKDFMEQMKLNYQSLQKALN